MVDRLWFLINPIVRHVETLDRESWLYVFAGLVAIGFLCMRGFKSRL
jgi:hypothetical protein